MGPQHALVSRAGADQNDVYSLNHMFSPGHQCILLCFWCSNLVSHNYTEFTLMILGQENFSWGMGAQGEMVDFG